MSKLTLMGAVAQEETGYSIIFYDAGGCASCGDTLSETLAMGKDALQGWLEVAIDHGDPLPTVTEHTLEDVEAWLYADEPASTPRPAWLGLYPVEVDVPEYRDTVSLRVKAGLVEKIAELSRATAEHIDSARFIEAAVEHEIERYRKSAA